MTQLGHILFICALISQPYPSARIGIFDKNKLTLLQTVKEHLLKSFFCNKRIRVLAGDEGIFPHGERCIICTIFLT